jgi:RNase P/RNase MRP subunit POP5
LFEHKTRDRFLGVNTLSEIETAAESLSLEQKRLLLRFLLERLGEATTLAGKTRLVRRDNDVLLEAPPGAPAMTPENVKRALEDWP